LGVRDDVTAFTEAAAYNPVLDQELGIRSDNLPSDWNSIQPRLQMTWNIKGKNTDILKFGAGLFSAQPHYYAQVNSIQNSGLMLAAIDVTGPLVPTPDFISYRNDPSTVPGVLKIMIGTSLSGLGRSDRIDATNGIQSDEKKSEKFN